MLGCGVGCVCDVRVDGGELFVFFAFGRGDEDVGFVYVGDFE